MQLGPPLTGSGVSFMAGSFLLPMGQWQTPGGCHKFSRWGHGEPLKSPYWQFSCLGAINEPTAALVQHSAVADRLGGWQDRISTPLNSCFCEQQQGPLKSPGTLLGSLAGTAVHRGQPVGWISCPRYGGYTTAPYVFPTYHVCIRRCATPHALEVCLGEPVAGVDVSAGWACRLGCERS